ncbi:8-amino-7-oxononanoate+synthase+2 [Methylocapsa aurea]|uniref:8-amino-7-oxononanoate synthase n=1 Tax=Methylocapsa aurea TaxID=663610 RepID=UPI003D18DA73
MTTDQRGGGVLDVYAADLASLAAQDQLRALARRRGLDFTSNDFLALAESQEYRDAAAAALARGVPIGAGGSRLLRGDHEEHAALEREAAAFFHAESALYFGAGFSANEALLATLPQRGDLIVHDSLVHASAHEGMRLSRAETVAALHNDADAFEDEIAAWRRGGGTGRPWIVVESLYSMDGDFAPLAPLAEIAARHDAFLLIDEAHATGVHGPGGRGLAAALEGRENVVTLHTCGKALGVFGGLVLLPAVLREFLINRCRQLIFATAPSPLVAACLRAALPIVERAEGRRAALRSRVAVAARELQAVGLAPPLSQIAPIVVGSNARALALAAAMQALGYDIRAIRPPTVADGTARLRISLTLHVSETQISAMIDDLAHELSRLPP